MGAIFLSYARDDRGFAERLAHVLEAAGHDVWWDRRLDGGEEFSAGIEAALDKAELVVVAWSGASVKSRWVRDEAAVGVEKGRLVAVSIDGTRPPIGFRQFHTLDLTGWKGEKRDGRSGELLRSVERRLTGKANIAATPVVREPVALPKIRRLWIAAAALVLLIAAATGVFLVSRNHVRGPATKPTIALLPFSTATPDAELREIAAQARESVSHTLSQSGIPVRLVDLAPSMGQSAGDFLLSGDVSRSADTVIATVHLDEAAHGVTIVTRKFEAAGEDVRNLPERIGAQMAGFFDGSTLMILDRKHPIDPAIIVQLLADSEDELAIYQAAKRVAAARPDEPNALMTVAFFTNFVLGEIPAEERPQAVNEGRRAAEKALKLAPNFGDTYATWCLLRSETLWAACEDRLRMGNRIDPDAPYLNGFLALILRRVGRFDDSIGLGRMSYTHDPYNYFKLRDYLRQLEFTGDSEAARELYAKAARWYPQAKSELSANMLVGLLDRGDFHAYSKLEQDLGPKALLPDYRDSGALAVDWQSRSAVRQKCRRANNFLFETRCMLVLANLNDLDAAYTIADKLYPRRLGRTPEETERIWLDNPSDFPPIELVSSPGAAALRRDPRYVGLAQRLGLLDYWRGGRLPDFCRKKPEAICSQLLSRH